MKSFKDLLKWYFSRGALPYWSILLLDSAFVLFSGLLAYTVHHGAEQASEVFVPLVWTLGLFLLCFVVAFRVFHTYDGVIRFSSFNDLMRVTLAVVCAIVLVFILEWLLGGASWLLAFTTADIILFGLFVVAFMWTIRVWVKTLYEESLRRSNREPAFILGVKTGGAALAKNMNSSEDSPFKVAGFVTGGDDLDTRFLMGVQVHRFDSRLAQTMKKEGAKALIVSPLMMNVIQDNPEIVDSLVEAGVKIMVMPNAREWDGKSDLRASELQPVDVEDLLPREKIEVDMKAAADLLENNVVLITGAAGSIGSEMVRQIATYRPKHMILVDQAETPMHDIRLMMHNQWPDVKAETIVADIADPKIMERIFSQYKPEYVFHAAA
ncbi:MAG: SDR family NAD(P)-dependent oxidoreductase, partial [Muribaculaceae bacterium]|nr:SDR family NAD(P)-dependent oxidoreductase [Muribaculaceae bacterium]